MSKSKALLTLGMSPSRAAAAFGAKSLIVASAAAMPLVLWSASARALEPIELLGKNLFFDTSLSTPGNKQGCVSCHAPAKGWAFPDAGVNAKTVVAPGAAPHRLGNIKPPNNSYMSLAPASRRPRASTSLASGQSCPALPVAISGTAAPKAAAPTPEASARYLTPGTSASSARRSRRPLCPCPSRAPVTKSSSAPRPTRR